MDDAYLIRDAIVGKPTDAEKSAAVAALGDLIRDLAEARAALERLAWAAVNHYGADYSDATDELRDANIEARRIWRGGQPT